MAVDPGVRVPFLSGLAGALIGALSSFSATWLVGRQRREERREVAKLRVAEREAADKRRNDDRVVAHSDESHERLRAEVMGATSAALSLAADIENRPAPRSMHITPAEQEVFQTRATTAGNLLAAVAITFPGDQVASAAKDTALKISQSLGMLVERSNVQAITPEEEDEIAKAAVDRSLAVLDTVRIQAMAMAMIM